MPRTPKIKNLIHTRLANAYGGWMYCEGCQKTIGYLCYVTYDHFSFAYKCKCGASGNMKIAFEKEEQAPLSDNKLIILKNRLCCPKDESPLFTVLEKNLEFYNYKIECIKCKTKYSGKRTAKMEE